MKHADYNYLCDRTKIILIDLNLGNMSLTNDIEYILTEISNIGGVKLNDRRIFYIDSTGEMSELFPEWDDWDEKKCINVIFL